MAWVDQFEINFNSKGPSFSKRLPKKVNRTAYTIDKFVEEFNKKSNNRNVVFVHCAMGMSRSATCVIM